MKTRPSIFALFCLVVVASPAQTTLFSDTFVDGLTDDAGNSSDAAWFNSSTSGATTSATGLTMTPGRGLYADFTPTSLARVGDNLEFSLTFTVTSSLGTASSNGLRYGFFSTGSGTAPSANGFGSSYSGFGGSDAYAGAVTVQATSTDSTPFTFLRKITAAQAFVTNFGTNPNFNYNSLGSGGPSSLDNIDFATDGTVYNLVVSVTKTDVSEITLTASLHDVGGHALDGLTYSYTDTTSPLLNFNGVAFSLGSNTFTMVASQATLTTTAVPEPSTYAALAGLGAFGAALWFRRRVRA